tara:strand:+ start:2132 stop:3418 length:1287 start_codon:yes stop_codon:yes gene_type:complete
MADTLTEIYRNTLTSSDFDSNGEATIVTTNSSTSHVIKNIQVSDTDANIKINGTLKVNDFDVVSLSANSSGSEIIAPSSTVKVKTNALPLTFQDAEFQTQNNSTNYRKQTVPSTISGSTQIILSTDIYNDTNTIPSSMSGVDNTNRIIAYNLEGNNNHYVFATNGNQSNQAYIYSNSNSTLYTHNLGYTPQWFDGHRYAWWWRGDGNPGIYRVDTHSDSPSNVYIHNTTANNTGSQSSYARIFGVKDEWLFWWPEYNGGRMWAYNIATDTVTQISTSAANNVITETTVNRWYAIKRGTDSYRWVTPNGNSSLKYWDWTPSTVRGTGDLNNHTDLILTGTSQHFNAHGHGHAVFGSRLYYLNDDSRKVSFIDFGPDTPTLGVVGTNDMSNTYGSDLSIVLRTPDSSTVNARSGYPNPSLKLRVTGITST